MANKGVIVAGNWSGSPFVMANGDFHYYNFYEIDKDGKQVPQNRVDWSVKENGAATLTPDKFFPVNEQGVMVTTPDRPAYSEFTLVAHTPSGAHAEQIIKCVLLYPKGIPYLAYNGSPWTLPWNFPEGQRAARVIYDVLMQMPDSFLKAVGEVPIFLHNHLWADATGMTLPFPFNQYILIDRSRLSADPKVNQYPFVLSDPGITQGDIQLAATVVHELSHVALVNRCFVNFGDFIRFTTQLLTQVVRLANYPALVTPFAPFAAVSMFAWRLTDWFIQDFATEFAQVADWELNEILTDWLIRGFNSLFKANAPHWPNAYSGWRAEGWLLGLRNMHGMLDDLQRKEKTAGDLYGRLLDAEQKYQAAVKATPHDQKAEDAAKEVRDHVQASYNQIADYFGQSGFVSAYAATDLHEDWAETLSTMTFDRDQINSVGYYWFGSPRLKRKQDFMVHKGFWPSKQTPVKVGSYLLVNNITMNSLPVRFVDPPRKQKGDAQKKSQKTAMKAMNMEAADAPAPIPDDQDDPAWSAGYTDYDTKVFDQTIDVLKAATDLGQAMDKAKPVFDALQPMQEALSAQETLPADTGNPYSTLAFAETHGEGLSLFDASTSVLKVGDLAVDPYGRTLLVIAVDEKEHISSITGDAGDPKLPEPSPATLTYYWSPIATVRTWKTEGASGNPAFADLDATLTGLINLWGLNDTGDDTPKVGTPGGLLREGLRLAGFDAPWPADSDDPRAFCLWHGAGLSEPQALQLGDVVFLDANGTSIGFVLRSDEKTFDAVCSGTGEPGPAGEPKDAVRVRLGVPQTEIAQMWRPSREGRQWVASGQAATPVFSDLNKVLNGLASMIGSDSPTVRAKSLDLSTGPWWALLNIALSAAGTAEGMKYFKPADVDDGTEDIAKRLLLASGRISSGQLPSPGDWVLFQDGGKPVYGVALEVTADGLTKAVTSGKRIALWSGSLPASAIQIAVRPGLASETELPAFYGSPATLWELMKKLDRGTYTASLDGENYSFDLSQPAEFAMALAANAPEWMRKRIWSAQSFPNEMQALQLRLDTLGVGLSTQTPPMAGDWCLLKRGGFGVAITDSTIVSENFAIRQLDPDSIDALWRPSTDARHYADTAPGYEDLNAAIGMLRTWGNEKASSASPLFGDADLLGSGFLNAEVAKTLKKGPDVAEDWPAYLDGKFAAKAIGEALPGDFLQKGERQGIALDSGDAVKWDGDSFSIGKVTEFEKAWRL